uniref:TRAF3 interacting protein 3 n=1 Tax=Microcebus murinus TaxID=30608 RepID=A0A8C5VPS9_MICMU
MISPDSRPSPGLAWWAESYEAKCERRQETRESRLCRPNVTTCRQVGKALRIQQREQVKGARLQQFLRRRNLELEKDKARQPQAKERGPSRRSGQETVAGTSSEVVPAQHPPPSGIQRDPADHLSLQSGGLPPQDCPTKKPPRHHRSTQTKAEEAQPTIKNDASHKQVSSLHEIIQLLSTQSKWHEALQRELVIKQKMVASDSTWRSLENQLYACSQKYSPWGIKKVLLEMEDQKNSYEQKAKESLQKVLEEKMNAEQQLQSTQRSLALAEQKCEEWRSQYEALKEDWRTLGTQHRELESQLHVLQSKLQGADSRDLQMNQALRLLENEHQELQAKIERLQGDRDLCSSDTQDLQDQLKRSEEEKLALVTRVQQLQSKWTI